MKKQLGQQRRCNTCVGNTTTQYYEILAFERFLYQWNNSTFIWIQLNQQCERSVWNLTRDHVFVFWRMKCHCRTHLLSRYLEVLRAISRVTTGGISTKRVPKSRARIHQLLAWISRDAHRMSSRRRFLCCCKTILVLACYAVDLPGFTAASECVWLYIYICLCG